MLLTREPSPEPYCFIVQLRDSCGLEPSMPFSPHRYCDGHHSSYLLRAMAQVRRQLRAHLPRTPPAPSRSPFAWHWVGGGLLGPVVLSKCPRLYLVALCEAEEAPPACSRPYVVESHFNWKLFWQFLHPHLLVLGAAIVVRSSPISSHQGQGRTEPGVCRSPRQNCVRTASRVTKSQGRPRSSEGCPRARRRAHTGLLGVQGAGIPRGWRPGF